MLGQGGCLALAWPKDSQPVRDTVGTHQRQGTRSIWDSGVSSERALALVRGQWRPASWQKHHPTCRESLGQQRWVSVRQPIERRNLGAHSITAGGCTAWSSRMCRRAIGCADCWRLPGRPNSLVPVDLPQRSWGRSPRGLGVERIFPLCQANKAWIARVPLGALCHTWDDDRRAFRWTSEFRGMYVHASTVCCTAYASMSARMRGAEVIPKADRAMSSRSDDGVCSRWGVWRAAAQAEAAVLKPGFPVVARATSTHCPTTRRDAKRKELCVRRGPEGGAWPCEPLFFEMPGSRRRHHLAIVTVFSSMSLTWSPCRALSARNVICARTNRCKLPRLLCLSEHGSRQLSWVAASHPCDLPKGWQAWASLDCAADIEQANNSPRQRPRATH